LVAQKKLPIRWDIQAKENLDAIYDYIADVCQTSQHPSKIRQSKHLNE
jgi:hypothetical protein